MHASPPYRIQIAIDPATGYWRQVIQGIYQYGFDSGRLELIPPSLFHVPHRLEAMVASQGIQGFIASIHLVSRENSFRRLPVPTLNVSNALLLPRLPVITQDDHAVGRLAAEHLRDCGCARFVFWGQARGLYSSQRLDGFKEIVRTCGTLVDAQEMRHPFGWSEYQKLLGWLRRQTPPLGLFAAGDIIGSIALRAARELKWRVPEDLAVIGADDDEFIAGFERPPLSSIRLPPWKVGYQAATEIDRLLSGRPPAKYPIRLPPDGLTARQSTDVVHANDAAVVKAVRFIRNHATVNPYVSEIVRVSGVSRSALQVRFKTALGRSMLQEIQAVRIARAKLLLGSTSLKLDLVAERCGFPNSQRFSVVFSQFTGTSPGRYRREHSPR